MDYKYINQLLERYWDGETSLEEEKILRTFFSQDVVPADLRKYKELFAYGAFMEKEEVLGEDFERKVMSKITMMEQPKAKVISMTARLKPLFKAAAVVAIFLTLGNAAQVSFNNNPKVVSTPGYHVNKVGTSVALNDSVVNDSVRQGKLQATTDNTSPVFIK